MLIDYKKDSSKLGLLNEEYFASNPTSRGWSLTNVNFNISYSGSGISLIGGGVQTAHTLTLETSTPILIKQLMYLTISNSNRTPYRIYVNIYLNNILIKSYELYEDNRGAYTLYLYKKDINNWLLSSNGTETSPALNTNIVNNIKMTFAYTTGSSSSGVTLLTVGKLKWI